MKAVAVLVTPGLEVQVLEMMMPVEVIELF